MSKYLYIIFVCLFSSCIVNAQSSLQLIPSVRLGSGAYEQTVVTTSGMVTLGAALQLSGNIKSWELGGGLAYHHTQFDAVMAVPNHRIVEDDLKVNYYCPQISVRKRFLQSAKKYLYTGITGGGAFTGSLFPGSSSIYSGVDVGLVMHATARVHPDISFGWRGFRSGDPSFSDIWPTPDGKMWLHIYTLNFGIRLSK